MISSIKKFFNSKWHKQLFIYALYVSYIMIFISLTGAVSWAPEYLSIIQKYIIYYISIILIVRFNPYMNITTFDKYDKRIIFSAGITLLLTTSAVHIFENYIVTELSYV
jgi:hypothetical protein